MPGLQVILNARLLIMLSILICMLIYWNWTSITNGNLYTIERGESQSTYPNRQYFDVIVSADNVMAPEQITFLQQLIIKHWETNLPIDMNVPFPTYKVRSSHPNSSVHIGAKLFINGRSITDPYQELDQIHYLHDDDAQYSDIGTEHFSRLWTCAMIPLSSDIAISMIIASEGVQSNGCGYITFLELSDESESTCNINMAQTESEINIEHGMQCTNRNSLSRWCEFTKEAQLQACKLKIKRVYRLLDRHNSSNSTYALIGSVNLIMLILLYLKQIISPKVTQMNIPVYGTVDIDV